MGFKRGVWRCEVQGCGHDAELSLVTVISTGGARKERLQAYASAVRLCMVDAKQLAGGKMVPRLAESIKQAIGKLVSGECRPSTKRK